MIQVLLVGTSAERSSAMVNLLTGSGHDVIAALGFEEAIRALAGHSPDLLISEVRLGAFNGMHLVIRCRITHPAMRTIVLDRAYDSGLEVDAQRHGAVYLVEPVDEVELLAHVSQMRAEITPQRRWPRKQVAGGSLVAHVAHGPARVVDLSYGGLRLELLEKADVASGFDVAVPGFGITVRAKPVWTCPAPSGWFWCGAELSEANPQALSVWRRFVDSVHDAA
jgi:DNA-binding response OmpR family regulator